MAPNAFRVLAQSLRIGFDCGMQQQRFAGAARNDVKVNVRNRLSGDGAIHLHDHDAWHIEGAFYRAGNAVRRADTDPWGSP